MHNLMFFTDFTLSFSADTCKECSSQCVIISFWRALRSSCGKLGKQTFNDDKEDSWDNSSSGWVQNYLMACVVSNFHTGHTVASGPVEKLVLTSVAAPACSTIDLLSGKLRISSKNRGEALSPNIYKTAPGRIFSALPCGVRFPEPF